MKEYTKPLIEDEEIELEDVIAASTEESTNDGEMNQFPWS